MSKTIDELILEMIESKIKEYLRTNTEYKAESYIGGKVHFGNWILGFITIMRKKLEAEELAKAMIAKHDKDKALEKLGGL